MINPSKRVLTAIASLESDEDFKTIVEWINESLNAQRIQNDTLKDAELLRWGQGKAQQLNQLLVQIHSARDCLHRVASNT